MGRAVDNNRPKAATRVLVWNGMTTLRAIAVE
jgi:hypothetical protein